MEKGISDNDSVKRVLLFLEHQGGRVTMNKTIRRKKSSESMWTN